MPAARYLEAVAQMGSTYLIANRLPVNAAQERLGHFRPDIVLIHYANCWMNRLLLPQ